MRNITNMSFILCILLHALCAKQWMFLKPSVRKDGVLMSSLVYRSSSAHENDRLSSVAAELQFKSLSRHSSPTEDREGTDF